MTARILSPADLQDRLVAAGQALGEDDSGRPSTVVRPAQESILTIAANLDPTLEPSHRGGYFACLLRSEADRTPALRDEPAFSWSLDELGRWPNLIEDCSGYHSDWDDDQEP